MNITTLKRDCCNLLTSQQWTLFWWAVRDSSEKTWSESSLYFGIFHTLIRQLDLQLNIWGPWSTINFNRENE